MLTLQTITTISPIRSEEDLVQAQHRLDELLALDAYAAKDEHLRDEVEVLTALIHYYEQRTIDPQQWSLAGADVVALIEEGLFQQQLSVAAAAQLLQISEGELAQVVSRQQPISFVLAKRLHQRLGIPAEALLTLPE